MYFFNTISKIPHIADKIIYRILIILSQFVFKCKRSHNIDNIFIIADYEKFGGTRTYLLTLLNFYHKENKKVSVFVKEQHLDIEMQSAIKKLDFNYYVLVSPLIYRGNRFKLTKRLLSEAYPIWNYFIKQWPDLIVITTAGYFDLLGNIVMPTRFIYILHSYPREALEKYYRNVLKLSLGNSKKLLTVSNFSKEKILQYWLLQNQTDHVHVIYNSLEDKNKSQINLEIGPHSLNPTLKVITLGHAVNYKNPLLWIEIAKKVIDANKTKNIEFIWVGDGELFDTCCKKVEELQLNNVLFLGYHKDVEPFYKDATIYFQPSLLESFGLSVLKGMSYKLPCVVSNVGGLPELVIDGATGFIVELSDTEVISKKINTLLHNSALRQEMGEAAYELYQAKFSYTSWKNKMVELHQLIN